MNMVYLLEQPADQFVAGWRATFSSGRGTMWWRKQRFIPTRPFSNGNAAQPAEGEVDRGAAGLHELFFTEDFPYDQRRATR